MNTKTAKIINERYERIKVHVVDKGYKELSSTPLGGYITDRIELWVKGDDVIILEVLRNGYTNIYKELSLDEFINN